MNLPTISIASISYNTPISLWKKSLDAIDKQDYPKAKIEHIIVDAGSPRETIAFLKKYHTRTIIREDLLEKPLVRMSMGIKQAKGDLVLLLEPDNIVVNNNWLKQMVQPFTDYKDITGTISKYNAYEPSMPLFTKYCALFGVNDPLLYYLHKSDKLPRFESEYKNGTTIIAKKNYTIVSFTNENLPTLGDNGHMVRREIIMKVNKDPYAFLHTDAFAELTTKGYTKYAIVNNSIIHYTGSSVVSFFKRRVEYKARYYDKLKSTRKYLVYDPNSPDDRKNLLLFIIYSLTFIQPIFLSIRGFIVVHDIAWFLHPVACFMTLAAYGYSELRNFYTKLSSQTLIK